MGPDRLERDRRSGTEQLAVTKAEIDGAWYGETRNRFLLVSTAAATDVEAKVLELERGKKLTEEGTASVTTEHPGTNTVN